MTISSITPEAVADLDGTQSSIPFDFSLEDPDHLEVYRDETLLVRTVDYDVIAPVAENAGQVTLIPPLVAGRYELVRATTDDQTLDLEARKRFPSAAIESTFDKIIRLIQELAAKATRAIKQSLFDATAADVRGLRLINVADPEDDQDAVTRQHLTDFFTTLPPGPQGPAGPAIPGPPGISGPAGVPLEILTGVVAPPTTIGIDNQLYLNTLNGDLYQRTSGSWVLLINLIGPPGSGGGGGVTDHGALTGLSDPDHPIAAVQGLQASLDGLSTAIDAAFANAPVVYRQDTAPTGTIPAGSLWFDTLNGDRVYYYDGATWIDVHDAELDLIASDVALALSASTTAQATADGKVTTFVSPTEPIAEGIGDLWIRDSDNTLHRWSGTVWIQIQDTGIIDALNNAAGAQATADGKIVSFYQATAPAIATAGLGDIWYDTDDENHPYRFNGSTWVTVRDASIFQVASDLGNALSDIATLQATVDGVVNIFYEAVAPTVISHPELALGDLWIDSADNVTSRWDGAAWVVIQDDSIAQAVTDSSNAVALADQKIRAFYQNAEPTSPAQEFDTGDLWFDLDDFNRLYRYNGSAWLDVAAINDIVDGEVGTGGLQPGAVSIVTEAFGLVTDESVLLSPDHTTDGQRIFVRGYYQVDQVDISGSTDGDYTFRIRRRVNAGAFTTLAEIDVSTTPTNNERSGLEVGEGAANAVIAWQVKGTLAPGKQFANFDFRFEDQVASGDVQYELAVTARPLALGLPFSNADKRAIYTTELKR